MFKFISLLMSAVLLIPLASYADSEIVWQEPNEYRDIDSVDVVPEKFQKRIFKEFEKHLADLTADLPEGQKLVLTVTDLDLAGRVLPGYAHGFDDARNMRVIERLDYPRINFSYQLTDGEGKVIKEGKEKIKDMNFQRRGKSHLVARDPLGYEKRMLTEWFAETFSNK